MDNLECLTEDKLKEHCAKRQQTLDAKLETIYAAQGKQSEKIEKILEKLGEVGERIAKIEGAYQADHK
jgi:hypothetical protein